jgi:hypothetical protein
VTLTIQLPDEQTAVLAAKARAQGLSAEEYALQVLEQDLVPEWLRKSWQTSQQAGLDGLSTDEIDAEIAAARKARRESRLPPGA